MAPDVIGIHGPLFVNAICHSIGVVVFGLLCLLFAVDYQRTRANHHLLPAIASGLAFLWNLGSVIVLARGATPGAETDLLTALSFSVLTILPAVLLHIAIGRTQPYVVIVGYTLTFISVLLHCLEAWTGRESYHHIAILFMTAGFAALTMVSIGLQIRTGSQAHGSARRLATSMCLFLIAMSFAHFGSGTASHAWAREIAFHHAGIPLALYVLLQDHRFLMLDAFVRMLSSVGLAALAVYMAIFLEHTTHVLAAVSGRPVWQGLLILAACVALALFAVLRNAVQGLLTRVVFGRRNLESAVEDLRRLRADSSSEDIYIASAAARVAQFMEADRYETVASVRPEWAAATEPFAPSDLELWRSAGTLRWVYAVVPVRRPPYGVSYILLGARRGNRRYLSEDFKAFASMAAAIGEEANRYHALEMQALVSEAELRALQAQINPHFLFNALNTLYGTIKRENAEARRLVLNLSDVLRYALGPEQRYIPLETELRIVRAYLEIEQLRLGSKLETDIRVDEATLRAPVPVLSIQPLIENAVKHGVAKGAHNGYVRLTTRREGHMVQIEIANSGELQPGSDAGSGAGLGLKNVRRRLALCYGEQSELSLATVAGETVARFAVPL
jgi:hypothetical protein